MHLATLPPLIATGDPHSFAEFTFKVRDPRILQDLEEAPWFSPDLRSSLAKFRQELLGGVVQPLREDAPDTEFWKSVSKPYIGRSWLDVPWYWAEAYFYRRILEIIGYFQIGAWHERDPFAALKGAELKPEVAPRRVSTLLETFAHANPAAASNRRAGAANVDTPPDRAEFEHLLHAALWGNRVDLSYNVERQVGRAARVQDERENLLVDDAPRVSEFFASHLLRHVIYVTDNAGTELALDLALIDFMLARHPGRERPYVDKLTLHLKPQPFYVSDAMPQDVEQTLTAFAAANAVTRALAERLRAHQAARRLVLRTHWFYPTSLQYFEAPDDLFEEFKRADFVVFKGDVNYRRLVGDAHWATTIAFEYPTRYFPAPLVTLRTLKSEPIVGLKPGQADDLYKADREWRVNGKRGVAQARF
jgi:uncharacterized protein with ATP-grasp and redox domains